MLVTQAVAKMIAKHRSEMEGKSKEVDGLKVRMQEMEDQHFQVT